MGQALDTSRPERVFTSATRRALAFECRGRAVTVETLAAALGLSDGGLRHTIKELASARILVQQPNPNGRGFVYELNESEWGTHLDRALARQPGLMLKGQRVYLVGAGSVDAARDFLHTEEHEFVWSARLTPDRLLLGAHPDLTPSGAKGLEARFQVAGLQVDAFIVDLVERTNPS